MTTTTTNDLPALDSDHDLAMRCAATEYERLLALVDTLGPDEWSRPTDCTDWNVAELVRHVLGMLELNADPAEAGRQLAAARARTEERRCRPIDALTGLQVEEHAHVTLTELPGSLRSAVPPALAARRARTAEERARTFTSLLPGEGEWTLGYLFDVVHTRDPWIHRIDIARATGHEMVLTADHDGVVVADVVREWAARHGRPFTLVLEGIAGGRFAVGEGGPDLRCDAVEFCQMLSGRRPATGLLATPVPF